MKIALVNKHYRLGGIETVVHQLWKGLPTLGIDTELYVAQGCSPGARRFYPRVLGRLQRTRFQPTVEKLFPRLRLGQRVFRKLATSDFDVIHVHGFDESYASFDDLVALSRVKPVAVTLHGSWLFTGGCGQVRGCTRFEDACGSCPQAGLWPIPEWDNTASELARKAKILGDAPIRVVSPASHLADDAHRSVVGKRWRIDLIPNGVDVTQFHPGRKHDAAFRRELGIDPGALVLFSICRNFREAEKGGRLFREALAGLQLPGAHLVLVGDGSDWVASAVDPSLRTTVLPAIYDQQRCRAFFDAADVFVFPSLGETFPCVVLEAMAAGCCVVSTPLRGVLEQIEHLRSGILAEDFTAPAFARALGGVCASGPERIAGIGHAARERADQEFSEKRMLERHGEFYRRLVE